MPTDPLDHKGGYRGGGSANEVRPPRRLPSATANTGDREALTEPFGDVPQEVIDARRALHALRLEVAPAVADDVATHVEAAFAALAHDESATPDSSGPRDGGTP